MSPRFRLADFPEAKFILMAPRSPQAWQAVLMEYLIDPDEQKNRTDVRG